MAYSHFLVYMNGIRSNSMNPNMKNNQTNIPNPYASMEWQNQMVPNSGAISPAYFCGI